MNKSRIFSCLLACAIQISPAARLAVYTPKVFHSNLAIISTWTAGLAAMMGSINAVSGASTVLTSPSSSVGKVGETFSYRITTAPDPANTFSAVPLPPGLVLGDTRATRSFIQGIPTQAGQYQVTITASDDGRANRTISKILSIHIQPSGPPPDITSSPDSLTVDVGGTATFTAAASGTTPLTYQWLHNNAEIPGANSPTLTLSQVNTGHTGNYSVVVSNSNGLTESPAAFLSVNGPPYIRVEPEDFRVIAGESAHFSVQAVGPDALTYQWKKNGQDLVGQTFANLDISSADKSHVGSYSVFIKNPFGVTVSQEVELTLHYGNSLKEAEILTWSDTWKYEQSGRLPDSHWMDVDFDDSSWSSGTGSLYVESSSLPAAKGTELNLGSTTYYFRKIINIEDYIEGAILTLNTLIDDGCIIYLNGTEIQRLGMETGGIGYNTLADRTVGNADVEGPFHIETPLLRSGENVFAVEVHQTTLDSSDIVFGLLMNGQLKIPNLAPKILSQPTDQTFSLGENVSMTVQVDGTGPLNYQWQLNGINMDGEITETLSLIGISSDDAGNYTLVITNPFDTVTSSPIQISVESPLTIADVSPDIVVTEGSPLSLFVEALGSGPLAYQWKRNGADLEGQVSAIFNLARADQDHAGIYQVLISNESGLALSREITVVVEPAAPIILVLEQPRVSNDVFYFSINTTEATTVSIEYTDDLANPVWHHLETRTTSPGVNDFYEGLNLERRNRIYRVRVLN